ncbi:MULTISPECIES: DUF805 domain-containing protein [unclassified Brenneria]|uniref:DUF805 domain-containing protein n=1 Tax=unclassified Brenneria TaxID=2634434 RepID=UPI0029C1A31C|nr:MULTISPECIES: DUF805 domain-containing protein [unclassified Brenneria]MDX5630496.1 DUF805 domain-containing protein [Brenneria sp. L3-3Z]MDX5697695.1 DUF805 domain-containing protein [Brenneria sp. L4-2C]MEE3662971.1 DUF805 domain-containing protein [Brenneria sp. g21c3]
MQWYLNVLKNYVGFSGRARRKEYWMFYLFNIIVSFVIAIIDSALGLNAILLLIYSLAILLPGLAVTVRRLHDIGKSGWWILISMIPVVGGIVLLIFTCQDSQPAENQFGANPKLA